MADPRLVDYNISRLKDNSREVRLKSIEELRLLCDPAAMPALELLYRGDKDPDVRAAAQKAGLEIFQKNNPDVVVPPKRKDNPR